MPLRYQVQVYSEMFGWSEIVSESIKAYCQGYMCRIRDESGGPTSAWRLVDTETDKVLEEISARADVSLGIRAGHPPPEAYERAASRALEVAEAIRKQAQ